MQVKKAVTSFCYSLQQRDGMQIEASRRPGCPFFHSERVSPLGFSIPTWSMRLQFEPQGSSLGVRRVEFGRGGGSSDRLGEMVECETEMVQEKNKQTNKTLPGRTPELNSVSRHLSVPLRLWRPTKASNGGALFSAARPFSSSRWDSASAVLALGSRPPARASHRAHPAALQSAETLRLG